MAIVLRKTPLSSTACVLTPDPDFTISRCVNATLYREVKSNGAACFVFRCEECGSRSSEIARDLIGPSFADTLPEWDRGKDDKFSKAWWDWYDCYLESPEWKRRRDLVMERAGGRCEGCRENSATQVHHLTYENVGHELLWELVAVCRGCHKLIPRKVRPK